MSFSPGKFPGKWKEARVVLIHKSVHQENVDNHRPVSVSNCLRKATSFNKVFQKGDTRLHTDDTKVSLVKLFTFERLPVRRQVEIALSHAEHKSLPFSLSLPNASLNPLLSNFSADESLLPFCHAFPQVP